MFKISSKKETKVWVSIYCSSTPLVVCKRYCKHAFIKTFKCISYKMLVYQSDSFNFLSKSKLRSSQWEHSVWLLGQKSQLNVDVIEVYLLNKFQVYFDIEPEWKVTRFFRVVDSLFPSFSFVTLWLYAK